MQTRSASALVAAVAALTLTSFAATPVAVWDGDFSATQTGYTLDLSGNALSQDKSTITIDQDVGVKVDFATGFADAVTVMFKYSDLSFDAQKTIATSFCSGGDENRTGVYLASGGTANGIWKTADWAHPASTAFSASSGVLAFYYHKSKGTGLYYIDSAGVRAEIFFNSDLKASGDTAINGCTIGGERAKTGATLLSAATDMKITGIAVFNGTLSETEMTHYIWPNDVVEYTLTLDGTATNWSEGTWKIDEATVDAPTAGYATINLTESTTLTVDEAVGLNELTVNAAPGAVLTLVNGEHGSFVAYEKVSVKSGVLQQGSASVLGATPIVEVASGATLDLNGFSVNAATAVYIAGVGDGDWPWALTSSGRAFSGTIQNLHLLDNATVGGANQIVLGRDWAGSYGYLGGYTLTKTGVGELFVRNFNTPGTGSIVVSEGTLTTAQWNSLNRSGGDTTLTIADGATVRAANQESNPPAVTVLNWDGTLNTASRHFIVKNTLNGGGTTAYLHFDDGATANLKRNLTVTSSLTLYGAMTFLKHAEAESDVVVTASGGLSSSGAISVGAGVTLDLGVNRPETTLSFAPGAGLVVRLNEEESVVSLAADSMPSSFVLYDAGGSRIDGAKAKQAGGVLMIAEQLPPESISINFHNGNELSSDGTAKIGLDKFAVAQGSWNSLIAANNASLSALTCVQFNGDTMTNSDMSATITGTRGHWNCSNLSSLTNILHGYIDDNASYPTPTVTVTGIPYDKYRVVIYHSTDTANVPFGYDLVNGIPLTGVSGHTSVGTANWGDSGPKDSANPLEEGVNVLVTPILPNNAGKTLTVTGHRISGTVARGCIAAIQIFDASEKNVDLEGVSNRFETVLSPGEGSWRFPVDGVVADPSGFGGVVIGTNGISHAFASTEGYANTAISVLAAIPETISGTLVALGVKGNNDVQAKYNGDGTFLLTYNGNVSGANLTVTSRKVDVSGVHAYTLIYSKNDGTVLYQDGVAIAIADGIKWKDYNAISSVEFGMRHGGGDVLTGLTAYAAYTHYWSTDVNSASNLFDTFDHSVFRDGNASLAKKAEVFTHLVGYGDTEGLLALMPHRTSTYAYGVWQCPLDVDFADGDYVDGLKIAAEPVTYDLLDVTTNALSASVLAKIADPAKVGTLVSFFVNKGARIDAVYNGDGKCYIRWGDGDGYARAWTDVLDVSGVHVWSLVYRNDGTDGTALYYDGELVARDSSLHWSGDDGRVKGSICFGTAANGARPAEGLEIYAVHTDFGADATFFSEAGINSAAVFDTFDFMAKFSDDTIAEKLVAFEYYVETGLIYDPSPVVTTDTVLHISEICPKPTARDPNGVEAGWIEIHNTSDTFAANLSDYSLTTANRGSEIKAAAALPDVLVRPGGYKIVYTTKEYPKEGVNDGSTPFITNGIIVAQLKINPKKFPVVQLRKGKEVVDSFTIPVDLPDNSSFAPAGGVWGDYSSAAVEPVEEETVEPAEEVEISDSMLTVSSSVSKNETEGFYSFANVTNGKEGILIDKSATEQMAEKDMFSISLTFRVTNNTAKTESTGMPLFFCRNSNTSAPYSGILAYINKDPYANIIIQIRDASNVNRNYQIDSDLDWLDGEWHTLEVSCGQSSASRISASVDGVSYLDTACGVAAVLNTNIPMCIGRAYDSSSWTAFTGDIKDIRLYSGDAFPVPEPDPVEVTSDKTEIVDAATVTRVILPTITPGAANNRAGEIAYGPNAGPLYGIKHKVSDWKAWEQAKVGEDYPVTLALNPMDDDPTNAIQSVSLAYRTDFGEIAFTSMIKGAVSSEEGQLWVATIPGTAITQAGHILRWAAVATDAAGNKWRTPSFCDPDNAYEWYGTLIAPPADLISENLQTFHIFADATAQANMDKQYDSIAGSMPYGARVQIYDSQTGFYYDNVRIDLRGNTTAGFRKKSHGIRFIKSQPLTCTNTLTGEKIDGLRKVSFIAEYSDPSFIRQALAFQMFKDMGLNVPYSYPVRLNMNGAFFQMAFHSNRFTDELIEDYYGLDPLGYAYKSVGTLRGATSAGGTEKKTPDDGNDRDLSVLSSFYATFADADNINESFEDDGMASEIPAVTKTVVKKFDLPAWLNYLAAARITQECDDVWANLCAYYDVNGTDTWMPLGYDFNVSLGAIYLDDSNYKKRWPDNPTMANVDNFKSHPFYGGNRVRCHRYNSTSTINSGNRAFEAVWQSPKFRRLYLRRLRTVMDEQLKTPGTTKEETPFWANYVVAYTNAITADAALDRAKWGFGAGTTIYWWPNAMNLEEGIADLWDHYVVPRREHLFVTHSVNNTEKAIGYGKDFNAGIPNAQSPIADLKAGFSVDNTTDETKTAIDDSEKIVIRNANAEAVDMSGWRLTGRFNMTLPAGTVVDSNDTITVVVDRKTYVAAHDAELTDQVIVGNAGLVSETTSQKLYDAKGEEILKVELPSDESRFLRFFAFDGVPVGEDVNEWVILTNISETVTLELEGINILIGSSVEKAKCKITLAAGTLGPGASLRLEQETYNESGWEKITNGELVLQITDANGTVGHSGSGVVQKDFDGYKLAKKYLQLTQFGSTFTGADLIIVDYPVTSVVPGADTALEAATQEEADAALADCEIVLSDEDKKEGLVTNVLKLVAVPVVSVDPSTGDETISYFARVDVDETKVDPPAIAEPATQDDKPVTVEDDDDGKTVVSAKISNAVIGLWYGYEVADELGNASKFTNDVNSFERAKGPTHTVKGSSRDKTKTSGFFRVKASATKPKPPTE